MAESVTQSSPNLKTQRPKKDPLPKEEQPLGEKAPGAPFAIVGWSYLLVLAIVTIIIAFTVWLGR
ncbi:hypothetical protein [Roseiconus lacunae]|uniref:Uncharacterized protein n=1 Tax=Roseiconus lacunae TaxID=2605694 RepID=A0ABT7PQB0_9BACT|nr:hypothetical protein [Roseiconus lacunae]MCD0462827.1 hypothetical protein [Roseiconus lacunae]MDM4018651.1 hypothetical protein [Roseiconus lacunae]WRQ51420.1 hypothetical protein U8335_02530 [Stieleria sp. HD01]